MKTKNILIVEDEFIIADVLADILKTAGHSVSGIADNVNEAIEMLTLFKPDIVLVDIYLKGKLTGIDLAKKLNELNIPFIYISANSNQEVLDAAKTTNPYGFIIKPFREKDVIIALEIAIYRYDNLLENGTHQTAVLQKKAAEILASKLNWELKILEISKTLQPYLPFEFISFGTIPADEANFYELCFSRIGFEEYQLISAAELMVISGLKRHELARLKSNDSFDKIATWYDENELSSLLQTPSLKKFLTNKYRLKSHLSFPLSLNDGTECYFNFYSRRPDAYQPDHLILCNRFEALLTNFMSNLLRQADSPLKQEVNNFSVSHHKPVIEANNPFSGIIGNSHLLLAVFDNVIQVAGSDSSVLILGESGTGKEKIAERIHSLSRRKDRPFIRINCAALPTTLIDSELFGHEKGAFTGAHERKTGRFEHAHTGTIFLDEIGELPLESQSKLLRVLQEKEIERIGGRSTIKTDVRIIAATNRNLDKEVAEGRFRLDLFYRINVFPIVMPPLRERKEDIPGLAMHFLNVYSRKTGKNVKTIVPEVLAQMNQYHWPGNIRELENMIERNVLLTKDDTISNMVLPSQLETYGASKPVETSITTMSEGERAHILSALRKCNGKIWGEGGAASLLNLPPTTLNSKMKKLGISKNFGL
ncbi:sigma 54-interacting transcriptional regulator [Pedobacter aquatilis]|uniref:sigma 54-interacting transcriptional regulator n=1 Tax=Pedobacter aquatilis TaxID=351343 RepID=UPI00292DF1A7|nr:sigma 54-interacting transcriptional regulator [Pedobacter aquatilis]